MLPFFLHRVASEAPVNYALNFNGTGIVSFGRFQQLDNLKKFAFQFWFNPSEWVIDGVLIEKGQALKVSTGDPGYLKLQINGKVHEIYSPHLVAKNWTHVTISNCEKHFKLMLDNKVYYMTENVEQLNSDEEFLYIGQNFIGRIDELRIFNNSLNDEYAEFAYFMGNTLNDLNPQWNDLIGYYKFDQYTCPNIVDYTNQSHGTMSAGGVTREVVTDNARFKYIFVSSYINFRRFGWANLDQKKFQLLNHLLLISGKTAGDGRAWIDFRPNNGEFTNTEYVSEFKGRKGLAHFKGQGAKMDVGIYPIPQGKFTFATWLYIEEWIEGAVIAQKYVNDKKGFRLILGSAADKTVTMHITGHDYVLKNRFETNKWIYFCMSTNNTGESALKQVFFTIDDWQGNADEGPAGGPIQGLTDWTGVLQTKTIFGQDFKGYLDFIAITTLYYNFSMHNELRNGLTLPDFEKIIPRDIMFGYDNYYKFDDPQNLGLNTLSWKEQIKTLLKPYQGRRGFTLMLSWQDHGNWPATLHNTTLREKLAQNMAAIVNEYDFFGGCDVDFEFPYSAQEWIDYGEFLKRLRELIKLPKLVTVTPHAYTCQLPVKYLQYLDYILFQCYGPGSIDLYGSPEYMKVFNHLINWGYPSDKIVLSYGTTTTHAFINREHKDGYPGEQTIKWLMAGQNNWTRTTDHTHKEGYDYYFSSFYDVYFRSQYMRDMNGGGIMYWDTISDVKSDHYLSQAKASSYALEGNVDLIVEKVDNAPPTPVPNPTPSNSDTYRTAVIASGICGGVLVVVVIAIVFFCILPQRKASQPLISVEPENTFT